MIEFLPGRTLHSRHEGQSQGYVAANPLDSQDQKAWMQVCYLSESYVH